MSVRITFGRRVSCLYDLMCSRGYVVICGFSYYDVKFTVKEYVLLLKSIFLIMHYVILVRALY